MMRNRSQDVLTLFAALLLALAAGGCAADAPHAHGDGAPHAAHGDDDHADDHGDDDHAAEPAGHGHAHAEDAVEVLTLWGDETQLFVEFPALVVGEPSPFAAHLTRLRDHWALPSGTVTVELSGDAGPVERFSTDGPVRTGLFRPVVRPEHAGVRQVTLRVESHAASEVHDMGTYTVFATRSAANAAAHTHGDAPDGISFLLEQQWPIAFTIAQVEHIDMRPNLSAFAQLALPSNAQTLMTVPREGRVVTVGERFPVVGDAVVAGAPLFAVNVVSSDVGDPAALDLAVDQSALQVTAAQRAVDRLRPLVTQGVVAQRRLDEAESALASAEAASRSARRRRSGVGQSQQVDGGRDVLEVPSPIDGVVAEVLVAPGTWVGEGQPVVRVVNPSRLWLEVRVPEASVSRIREVSGAWFTIGGSDDVHEVSRDALVSIGTEVDPATRTLAVRFAIDDPEGDLYAGMSVEAHLMVGRPQRSVAIPMTAVVDDSGADVVYVQTGGETFERRVVQLGIRDGARVAVLGVEPGEWIANVGAYSVKLASTSTESVGHGHAH